MTDFPSLILMLAPSLVLVAGACAVAIWAARLPDEQSSLVARLTGKTDRSGSTGKAMGRVEATEGDDVQSQGHAERRRVLTCR